MTSPPNEAPSGSRLLWSLRFHTGPLVLVGLTVLLLTAVAVARLLLLPPPYTATAAVIATDLEFSAERVPRLAEAIYRQDSVLADATRRGRLPWTLDDLRDEHAAVVPLEDNVLVNVEGRSADPELAVRTANSVAAALAEALRQSGTEASFAVQERAVRAVPDSRLVPVALTVLGGLLATGAVVLGLAALLLALRRPVTRPGEARQLTGAPVLTVVHLPRRGPTAEPLPGIAALQSALDQSRVRGGPAVVLLTAPAGADRLRSTVAVSYAHHLGLSRDVTLVGSASAVDILLTIPDESRVLAHDRVQPLPPDAGTTVVDGFDDEQAAFREPLPPDGVVLLVVPEGASQDEVLAVLDRFPPEDLLGLVFVVRLGPRRRGRTVPAGRTRWTRREPVQQDGPAAAEEVSGQEPSAAGRPGG